MSHTRILLPRDPFKYEGRDLSEAQKTLLNKGAAMNGGDFATILAEKAYDRHESTCDDRYKELRERVAVLAHVQMPAVGRGRLDWIVDEIKSIVTDAEALNTFQHQDPAPIPDAEVGDVLAEDESGKADAAHERMKDEMYI